MVTPLTDTTGSAGLAKIEAEEAAQVLARYEPSAAAAQLATPALSPRAYLEQLISEELLEDALFFLAYALPRREALWWGLRCVRKVTPAEPSDAIGAALTAVETWVTEPGDESRRAAMQAAEEATFGTPAGCLALAVFFSEGSMSPADCPPVPVGEEFCARTVAAAVHQASLANGPKEVQGTALALVDLGLEVAAQPAPWEDPA
jgi:hypothetical protein